MWACLSLVRFIILLPWKISLHWRLKLYFGEASSLPYQTWAWGWSQWRAESGKIERIPALTNSFGDNRALLRSEKPFSALTAYAIGEVNIDGALVTSVWMMLSMAGVILTHFVSFFPQAAQIIWRFSSWLRIWSELLSTVKRMKKKMKVAKWFPQIMNTGWCQCYYSFLIHISSFIIHYSSFIILYNK